jgi:hypothetical protein
MIETSSHSLSIRIKQNQPRQNHPLKKPVSNLRFTSDTRSTQGGVEVEVGLNYVLDVA